MLFPIPGRPPSLTQGGRSALATQLRSRPLQMPTPGACPGTSTSCVPRTHHLQRPFALSPPQRASPPQGPRPPPLARRGGAPMPGREPLTLGGPASPADPPLPRAGPSRTSSGLVKGTASAGPHPARGPSAVQRRSSARGTHPEVTGRRHGERSEPRRRRARRLPSPPAL